MWWITTRREDEMRFRKKLYCAATAAMILFSGTLAAAEETKPTAALDVSILSQYMWRGIDLSKHGVVIQPSMTMGYNGASLNLWGNFDTNNAAYDGAKYNETDVTLSYAMTFDLLTVSANYAYYALDAVEDGQEVYVTASLNTLLSPTLTIYRDIAHTPSFFVLAGISHSLPIYDKTTLTLGATASYYYSDDSALTEVGSTDKYRNFHNGVVSATFNIPVNNYVTVKPTVSYSFPLSSAADDYIESVSLSEKSDFIYGGVVVSFAF